MAQILVVEDDSFISELITKAMQQAGFKAWTAMDAESALRLLRSGIPDIILLDLVLPGMSGFEFLKQIKAEARTKDIAVIILSNLGSKEDIQQGLQLGAEAFLVKANFLMEDIVKKVKEVLKKKGEIPPPPKVEP